MRRAFVVAAMAMVSSASMSEYSFAQTCATPIPVRSNLSNNGNTCAASNSLAGYGSIPSPQTEIVYSFVAGNLSATFSVVDSGGFGATLLLMPSPCSSSTDIIAAGNAGLPLVATGLDAGRTYYVIMTGDPGGPAAACGTFTFFTTVPVELQSFSIE